MISKNHVCNFPKLYRSFATSDEFASAINKSKSYVTARLVGRAEFTMKDRILALRYLGQPLSMMNEFFPGIIFDERNSSHKDQNNVDYDNLSIVSIVDHLKDINKLYQDGILTDAEFRRIKRRILKNI